MSAVATFEAAPQESAPITEKTPCAHCGLDVGQAPIVHEYGSDGVARPNAFCCTGCATVYEMLHEAGLGQTYYRVKERSASKQPSKPAVLSSQPMALDELDSPEFLADHTSEADGGLKQAALYVDGVHCAACVWLLERLPLELGGVTHATLDLPRARLAIEWDPEVVKLSDVGRWLGRYGYAAHPARGAGEGANSKAERSLLIRMGVAWALAGNVMLLAFAFYSGMDLENTPELTHAARWLSLLLATGSVFYGGSVFFKKAWASGRLAFKSRSLVNLHMDTPISIGILVGYVHSAWATITGSGEVWFDSIAVLIAALLSARWLHLRSRRLAGEASERLLSLIPTMVRRVDSQTDVAVAVPAKDLERGDVVEVLAGEVIPVDGIVAAGSSSLNNAVLTGESAPVRVEVTGAVHAGATNLSSTLRITVEATGDESQVGSLLSWIRDSEQRRAPSSSTADRIGGWFVAAVLTTAVLAGLILWFVAPDEIATRLVALLVITCPCALGMATPLSMAVASSHAAKRGIYVKSDAALEHLAHTSTIVLDKTGTLTEGTLSVAEAVGDSKAIRLAQQLERSSNHPIAQAIVEADYSTLLPTAGTSPASDASIRTEEYTVTHGFGIEGIISLGGHLHRVIAGKPEWVEQRANCTQHGAEAQIREALRAPQRKTLTPVLVAIDGTVAAALWLSDVIRHDVKETIKQLHQSDIEVHLLSGDKAGVVQSVAEAVGIPKAHAVGDVDPEGKEVYVRRQRSEDGSLVMVGDGVNDAAALTEADVGIAVNGGSMVSMVSADIFLTQDGVLQITRLLRHAKSTMRTIRNSLAFSLTYNVLGAVAAILGFISPLTAAIAMPLSSLTVVAFALLQKPIKSD